MSFGGVADTQFNEEGYFAVVRAIERLALMVQQAGDSNANVTSPGDTSGDTSLGLAPGLFDPAKVEVGPDGNISTISASSAAGFTGLPYGIYTESTIYSNLSASGSVGVPGLFSWASSGNISFTPTFSGSTISGFDSAKSYLISLKMVAEFADNISATNTATFSRSSSLDEYSSALVCNTNPATGNSYVTHRHVGIITGSTSFTWTYDWAEKIVGTIAAAYLYSGRVHIIQLN